MKSITLSKLFIGNLSVETLPSIQNNELSLMLDQIGNSNRIIRNIRNFTVDSELNTTSKNTFKSKAILNVLKNLPQIKSLDILENESLILSALVRGLGGNVYEEKTPVSISVSVSQGQESKGNAYGSGTYYVNDNVFISAIPNTDYLFDKWEDGNELSVRQLKIKKNMLSNYIALFKDKPSSYSFIIEGKSGGYDTLNDAVNACENGDNIIQSQNSTLQEPLFISNKQFTLDMRGNTLYENVTDESSNNYVIKFSNGANTAFKNGNVEFNLTNGDFAIIADSNSDVTFENMSCDNMASKSNVIQVQGKLKILSSYMKYGNINHNRALIAAKDSGYGEIDIIDSTIDASQGNFLSSNAFYKTAVASKGSRLNIENSTINVSDNAWYAVTVYGQNSSIKNSIINGGLYGALISKLNVTIEGENTLISGKINNYTNKTNVATIKGGTFNNYGSMMMNDTSKPEAHNLKFADITGGSFDIDPSTVGKNCINSDYKVQQEGDRYVVIHN